MTLIHFFQHLTGNYANFKALLNECVALVVFNNVLQVGERKTGKNFFL